MINILKSIKCHQAQRFSRILALEQQQLSASATLFILFSFKGTVHQQKSRKYLDRILQAMLKYLQKKKNSILLKSITFFLRSISQKSLALSTKCLIKRVNSMHNQWPQFTKANMNYRAKNSNK